ncbi:hypothetical protein [Mycobacteroides abscessus]|uniref:hypothetical protein n=1 Tax=Mycobacteroides abscessus TaxID=36809 RepID=UPI000300C3D0|nr:hypothetical protein [Mycobacteroides abscessus]
MSKTRLALVAAAAVAGVALSACSTNTAGEAVSDRGGPVKPVWVDPTADGPVAVQLDDYQEQFNLVPVPGVKITHTTDAAGGDMCTIGPAVSPAALPEARGFLTAGHCNSTIDPSQVIFRDRHGSVRTRLAPATGVVNELDPDTGKWVDAAALWTSTVDPTAVKIAGRWSVAGVLTVAGVKDLLPVGAPLCSTGANSGVKCGKVQDTSGDRIRFDAKGGPGDSGGAVFTVDDQGRAHLVGIVKGGAEDGSDTTATYLDPALGRLGAHALVDPLKAVDPASMAGWYSTRFTPAS